VSAGRVISKLARWCGIDDPPPILHPRELVNYFRLEKLPKKPIIFGPDDDAWLLSAQR
jgi:hypothetical protein